MQSQDHLISTNLILEMILGCLTLGILILRLLTYIKSRDLDLCHVDGKHNNMDGLLSRARDEMKDGMKIVDEALGLNFLELACVVLEVRTMPTNAIFMDKEYEREGTNFLSLMHVDVKTYKKQPL